MTITRRTMFAGLAASIVAPAIIRTPGLLMPIKPLLDLPMTATEVIRRRLQLMVDPPLFYDDDGMCVPTARQWMDARVANIRRLHAIT